MKTVVAYGDSSCSYKVIVPRPSPQHCVSSLAVSHSIHFCVWRMCEVWPLRAAWCVMIDCHHHHATLFSFCCACPVLSCPVPGSMRFLFPDWDYGAWKKRKRQRQKKSGWHPGRRFQQGRDRRRAPAPASTPVPGGQWLLDDHTQKQGKWTLPGSWIAVGEGGGFVVGV